MTKVYIVNSSYAYERMYIEEGFELVDNADKAGLIQFTGGADVHPSLYGERDVYSYPNARRDYEEMKIFEKYAGKKPMAGVCRGAQFLCVANGGKLWQDVDNHAIYGLHTMLVKESIDGEFAKEVYVTSTHHQAMRCVEEANGIIIGISEPRSSERYGETETVLGLRDDDVEVAFFPKTKCYCFQPHPEMTSKNSGCRLEFFYGLKTFLGVDPYA